MRGPTERRVSHTKGESQKAGIKPGFVLEAFADLKEDAHQWIRRIEASSFVAHKDSVRGFVYEAETGGLCEIS